MISYSSSKKDTMKSSASLSKPKNSRKRLPEIAHKSLSFPTADNEDSSAALLMTPAPFTTNSHSPDKSYSSAQPPVSSTVNSVKTVNTFLPSLRTLLSLFGISIHTSTSNTLAKERTYELLQITLDLCVCTTTRTSWLRT